MGLVRGFDERRYELKTGGNYVPAAVMIGLCWAVVSGAALAEGNTALQHAALHKACAEQGGRFERSWTYNDQGTQWGEVLSCSTSAGYITCQANVCQGSRWALPDGVTAAGGGPDSDSGTVQFPADPAAFSAALAALSGK